MRTLRTTLSTLLLTSSVLICAQTNIFPEDGNVGVGTTTPENYDNWGKVLNVYGPYNSKITTASSSVNTGIWSHEYGFYGAPAGGMLGTYSNHAVSLITNKSAKMTITTSGNVGIGTTSPAYPLDVNGSLMVRGPEAIVTGDLQVGTGGVYKDIILRSGTAPSGYNGLFEIAPRSIPGSGTAEHVTHFKTATNGSGSTRHDILVDGSVGIGVSNPGVYKLAVNGSVRAKEVRVETGWSDFVFEEGYDLPTLAEVEAHIAEKGHLQDIPSAAEVAEKGISLGEMDAKLLQKIEELMLYTLAQQKEIEALKAQLAELGEIRN